MFVIPYKQRMLFCTILLISFSAQASAGIYRGYVVYDVIPQTIEGSQDVMKQLLNNDEIDIWKDPIKIGDKGTIMFPRRLTGNITQLLERNNFTFNIKSNTIDQLIQRNIRQNNRNRWRMMMASSSTMNRPDHTFYMRYQEIQDWIDRKISLSSSIATKEDIGRTYYHHKLTVVKISTNPNNKIIWIDGGIHAREWIAPATALFIIDKLLSGTNEANELLRKYQFYILPLVNPDGYEYTHTVGRLWRKNRTPLPNSFCRGVDLNRNFPFKWGGPGTSPSECNIIYRGPHAGSELETQAIIRKISSIKEKVALYLALHSFGQYILTPFGYSKDKFPVNYSKLLKMGLVVSSKLRRDFGRSYLVGSSSNLLYEASGGTDDFMSGELKIPYSYTIELPDQGRYGFILPSSYIRSVGRNIWYALNEFVRQI